MSHQLISRNQDLKGLRDDGYDIEIRSSHIVISDVPYVNSRREVKRGILVSELTLSGDETAVPNTHVIYFAGEYPCDASGSPLEKIRSQSERRDIAGIITEHSFSSKPTTGYTNYHEKFSTYIAILESQAQAIDRSVTAKTFPVHSATDATYPFKYYETASSRAGIAASTEKLKLGKVAVVGLGGTGSYILDLISKTPVAQIHLFDGDVFLNHNAFRSPGAPSLEHLRRKPKKVAYFESIYSRIHTGIVAHDEFMTTENVASLTEMNFVFLCIDNGFDKRGIVRHLVEHKISFIDVGMGINLVDGMLSGIVRTSTGAPSMYDHLETRIPYSNGAANAYSQNIQIADLNALNAALAVIKWKKMLRFYLDIENEHFSAYTLDGNHMINEDVP